jgi:hypothetical protein
VLELSSPINLASNDPHHRRGICRSPTHEIDFGCLVAAGACDPQLLISRSENDYNQLGCALRLNVGYCEKALGIPYTRKLAACNYGFTG